MNWRIKRQNHGHWMNEPLDNGSRGGSTCTNPVLQKVLSYKLRETWNLKKYILIFWNGEIDHGAWLPLRWKLRTSQHGSSFEPYLSFTSIKYTKWMKNQIKSIDYLIKWLKSADGFNPVQCRNCVEQTCAF